MKSRKGVTGNRGFALLVVFILMSAVTVGLVMLARHSFKGAGKNKITVARMNTVAAALRTYYKGHRSLPDATKLEDKYDVDDDGNYTEEIKVAVPVGNGALKLPQKFRLDGWGNYFYYFLYQREDVNKSAELNVSKPVNDLTVWVAGSKVKVGAVIISGGSDGKIEVVDNYKNNVNDNSSTIYRDRYKDTSEPKIFGHKKSKQKNDDIITVVNLQSEAIAIATNTLHVLASKTCSYICSAQDAELLNGSFDMTAFLTEFDLNNNLNKTDPWGHLYKWDGSNFSSDGPSGGALDDIVVAALHTLNSCGCK